MRGQNSVSDNHNSRGVKSDNVTNHPLVCTNSVNDKMAFPWPLSTNISSTKENVRLLGITL